VAAGTRIRLASRRRVSSGGGDGAQYDGGAQGVERRAPGTAVAGSGEGVAGGQHQQHERNEEDDVAELDSQDRQQERAGHPGGEGAGVVAHPAAVGRAVAQLSTQPHSSQLGSSIVGDSALLLAPQ